ncbi:MAG: ArdC-like ssDNA-binding domain-containing protein [Chloroflexota bacterium]
MPASEYSKSPDHQLIPQDASPQPSTALRDALAWLEQAVSGIHDSDSFRAYLDAQARFHRYSFSNTLLILSQRADATRVAGYQTWKTLGRQVRRGEHGMKIFVPMRVRNRRSDGDDGRYRDEQTEPDPPGDPEPSAATDDQVRRSSSPSLGHRLLFRVGTVYDITQTDGKPLPEIDVPVLGGNEGLALYGRLARVAVDETLTITRGSDRLGSSTMGFYSPTERLIVLREAAPRQMTKTLAHELAHHFGGATASSPEEETTAESVAYVVCARFGLDTGERSFPYVATWSRDPQVFRTALGTVQSLSHRMIERIESQDTSPATDRSYESG